MNERLIKLFAEAIKDREITGPVGIRFCRGCGEPFVYGAVGRGPTAKFCTDKCQRSRGADVARRRKEARRNIVEYRADLAQHKKETTST